MEEAENLERDQEELLKKEQELKKKHAEEKEARKAAAEKAKNLLIHGKENPILEEIDELEQEFMDDIPKYDFRVHKKWSWFKYLDYFRWILNAAVFGVPFSALTFVSIIWNLWFNIELNNFWAQGNLFLVFNTLYLFMQVFLSWWLIFEIPIWLRHFKVLRVFSLFSAFWYNFAYILFMLEYYYTIYLTQEKDISELHPF